MLTILGMSFALSRFICAAFPHTVSTSFSQCSSPPAQSVSLWRKFVGPLAAVEDEFRRFLGIDKEYDKHCITCSLNVSLVRRCLQVGLCCSWPCCLLAWSINCCDAWQRSMRAVEMIWHVVMWAGASKPGSVV